MPQPIIGRDELNLAEFPLGVLSKRVPDGLKSLEFRDQVRHPRTGERIDRVLKITPSGEYGLPTGQDDEVILGLIQLSKLKNDFTSREVSFTRNELIRLMRWPHRGWSYKRLTESLNRWIGVTLYYQNAWWNPDQETWVDEKFHLLDNVTEPEAAKSPLTVTWNQVVIRDIRRGTLKRLDLDVYFGLKSAGAKRAYRFLDKRFFRRKEWEFDLHEFACNHVGLSSGYHTGEIKRKLVPILAELEAKGFLEPLPTEQRFVKRQRGEWRIVLKKQRGAAPQALEPGLEAELTERKVTASTAAELVREHDEPAIREKIDILDWLVARRDPRVSRNPAGYLVMSIRERYAAPDGYEPKEKREARRTVRRLRQQAAEQQDSAAERQRQAEQSAAEAWLAQQPPAEREAIEREALERGEPFLIRQYRRSDDEVTREKLRRIIVWMHAAKRMKPLETSKS